MCTARMVVHDPAPVQLWKLPPNLHSQPSSHPPHPPHFPSHGAPATHHCVNCRPSNTPKALLSRNVYKLVPPPQISLSKFIPTVLPLTNSSVSLQNVHRLHSCQEWTCHWNKHLGLPRWRSGWESACQCGGRGFEPWSGKIPHAAERLGPWATTTEPARLEPVPRNKRGRDSERPAHRYEEWPPLAATGESPRTETKTQHSHK